MSKTKFDNLIGALNQSEPLLAVLVDPDKLNAELIRLCRRLPVACFLVGGSELKSGSVKQSIRQIKALSKRPVVLFPGDESQLDKSADGLLLLSLLSGRNPEYLISKHVRAAARIRQMKLAHIPVAYLLIGGGRRSSTEEITGTSPMDPKQKTLILHTAMAASQLGFKAIYLEAGSGAKHSISPTLVKAVKSASGLPVIVGGGIRDEKTCKALIKAGANMLVLGNALENDVHLIERISRAFVSGKQKG